MDVVCNKCGCQGDIYLFRESKKEVTKIQVCQLIFLQIHPILENCKGLRLCTLSAKDRGATKNPAVDLGTNFDASTFYQDVSSVLS